MSHPRLKYIPHYTSEWPSAFVLCFVITVVSACAQVKGKNYFPLANGAKWEYTGRFSSLNGREFNVSASARVDGETLINGKRYYKFITTSDFSGVPGINSRVEGVRYYRLAEDGIYFRPGNVSDKPDLLEMPLPIMAGVKWLSGTTEARAGRVGTIRVGNREYKDCLKITFRVPDGVRTTENYYAPNVGIIKIVYTNTTEPKSVVELILEKHEQ